VPARVVIVGGGISGLAAAHFLGIRGHDVTLVDASERPGGLLRSEPRDGFLCETGPQAILDGPEETRALIEAAGLGPRVLPARETARRRFVYVRGALRTLPTSPPALLTSNLLTTGAKLRLAREPFVPRRADGAGEESVLAFAERRFGAEVARNVVAPAVIGIYAGDAAALSVGSALPRLAAMEREHGSLLRAARALGRRAGPGRSLSFPGGLEELPRALAARLGDRRLVARAGAIERMTGGFRVHLDDRPALECAHVVLATPGAESAALLAPLAPEATAALRAVPAASVAIACLGFRGAAADAPGMQLDAYGFLVARGEGVRLLGCQYESSIFEQRAPAGAVLVRAILGGTFDPAIVDADDRAIVSQAIADLRRVAGLRREPDFTAVWRHRAAIPQYDLGHAERVRAADAALARLPGLHVLGHALRGVGVGDCIKAAAALAAQLPAGG
jgi:protoporphyrinogen/coproporphyrinogen III oxidase